jgi:hypothetical protein
MMMTIVAVQVAEDAVAAVTTMMTIALAAQVAEDEVAAVMTMMMTIAVAAQVAEVEVAVVTTTIMTVVDKTLVIKNVMPLDVLRLKHNVLKTKEAFASFVF